MHHYDDPRDDPRIKREALTGCVKSALRLGDFSHAYADGQLLARSSPNNAESWPSWTRCKRRWTR